jgi:hypothetical protein
MDRPKIYKSKTKGEIEIASMHPAHASMAANLLESQSLDPDVVDALRIHAHEASRKWESEHEDEMRLWTDQQWADRKKLSDHYERIMAK